MRYAQYLQALRASEPVKAVVPLQAKGNSIYLYDFIDKYGINAADVTRALAGIDGDVIIRLASIGGDVFEGIAIYNAISERARLTKVAIVVDSIAASIASVIALSGTELYMNSGSQLMVHMPWAMAGGHAEDFRALAATLDKAWVDTMRPQYLKAFKNKPEEMDAIAAAETWLSADEVIAAGVSCGMWEGEATTMADSAYAAAKLAASLRTGSTSLHAEVLPHATHPRSTGAVKLSTAVRLIHNR